VVLYDAGDYHSQFYIKALAGAGIKYDLWDMRSSGTATAAQFTNYRRGAVVRIVNSRYEKESRLTLDEVSDTMDFMGEGGSLLLIGQNMGEEFYNSPMMSYLKIDIQNKNAAAKQLHGVNNDFITSGLTLNTGGDGAQNSASCDVIIPYDNVEPVLYYDAAKTTAAAMKIQTCAFRAAYYGFGIEIIDGANARANLLYRTLDWLQGNTMAVGVEAPGFSIKMLDGTATSFLKEAAIVAKDKICILEFFATWCSSCSELRPRLAQIYSKYNKDIEIIAVSYNEKAETVNKYLQAHPEVGWKVYIDETGHGLQKYGVKGIPAIFIIDGFERRVRYIGANESVETISAEIEKVLKSKEEKNKFDKLNMPGGR
jgi:thiol-disulfide isomerase/thioredoxin